jgi:uncharacterized protein
MTQLDYRKRIAAFIATQAKPPDKWSHQPRLYQLAKEVAQGQPFDDDVLYAAAWMHDLGVFSGHRPEAPDQLAAWDHVAYAVAKVPDLLRSMGFPPRKIPAAIEAIRTHLSSSSPTSFEGKLIRDADILEQLGAIGILRTVSKVGRDTRFVRLSDALEVLKRNAERLPSLLQLPAARQQAKRRLALLRTFVDAVESEAAGGEL